MNKIAESLLTRVYLSTYSLPTRVNYLLSLVSQLQITAAVLLYSFSYRDSELDESLTNADYRILQAFIIDHNLIANSSEQVIAFMEKVSSAFMILVLCVNVFGALFSSMKLQCNIISNKTITTLALINLHVMFLPFLNIWGYQITRYDEPLQKRILPFTLSVCNIFYVVLTSIFSIHTLKKDALSQRPSPLQFIDTLTKIIFFLGSIIQVKSPSFAKWMLCILPLMLILTKLLVLVHRLPLYDYQAYKIGILISSSHLTAGVLNLFFAIFSTIENISVIFISAIITPLLARYLIHTFTSILYDSMNNQDQSLTIQYKRLIIFDKLFEDAANMFKLDMQAPRSFHEQVMLGIFKDHNLKCDDLNCFCQHLCPKNNRLAIQTNLSYEEIIQRYSVFKYKYIKGLYEEALRQNTKHSEWLRVLYAQFIIDHNLEDYPKALSLLHSILRKNKGIFLSHSIKILLKKISDLIHNQDKELDIKTFISCYQQSNKIKGRILEITKDTLKFWETFQQPDPKYSELYQQSKQINQKADKLDKFWNQFQDAYGHKLSKEYLMYAIYSGVVRHSERIANRLYKSYKNALSNNRSNDKDKSGINNNTLDDRRNITVIMSMEKGKVGKILRVTENVSKWYQWKPNELEGVDVNVLMPAYFQSAHSIKLNNYIENGKRRLMKNRLVFGINKSGYLIPQYLHIAPYPHIEKEFSFVGIMRPLVTNDDYILVAEDDSIIGMTENVSKDLNISLSEKKNIQDICPDYDSLNQIFSFMAHLNRRDKEEQHFGNLNYDDTHSFLRAKSLRLLTQDHFEIKDFYDQMTLRGCLLDFSSQDKGSSIKTHISYNCKIDQLVFSNLPIVRVLILKKLTQKKINSPAMLETTNAITTHKNEGESLSMYEENISFMNEFEETTIFNQKQDQTSTIFKYASNKISKFSKIPAPTREKETSMNTLISPSGEFEGHEEALEEGMHSSRYAITMFRAQKSKASEAVSFLKHKLATEQFSNRESERESFQKSVENDRTQDLEEEMSNKKMHMDIEHMSVGMSSRHTAKSNTRRTIYLYEDAIREKPDGKEWKILILLILAYFLMAIITVSVSNTKINKTMEKSLQASRTLRIGALSTFNLFELYRRTKAAYLVEKGYIPLWRSDTAPDYSYYSIQQTKIIINDLVSLNNQIGKFYHMLDESLLPQIFQTYTLKGRGTGEENLILTHYKGVNEFINSGLRLINKKQNLVPLDPNDGDFTFILSNVLNGPLIQAETLMDVLNEHIAILNDSIYWAPIAVFIIFTVSSFILLVAIFKVEQDGTLIKKKLFNSLMKIEEKEYLESVKNVNTFYTLIKEKELLGSQDYRQKAKPDSHRNAVKKEGCHSAKTYRKGNSNGIQVPALKRIITLIMILSTVIFTQGILITYIDTYTKESTEQNERLFQSNSLLAKSAILFSEVYEYVGENKTTTARNQPITSQIDVDFNDMLDRQSFFAKLTPIYASNSYMTQLLTGNVCEAVMDELVKTPIGAVFCPLASHSVSLTGLINMNADLLNNLGKVKDAYDSSNHTAEAIKQVIGMTTLRDAENLMGIVLKFPYIAIDGIMITELEETNQRYFKVTDTIGILLVAICVILLILSYKLIYLDALKDRIWNKRMLQMIPIRVIINNAHIKNYLKNVSKVVINIHG